MTLETPVRRRRRRGLHAGVQRTDAVPVPFPVPAPRTPGAPPPRICFVTGVGRSGTTAMVDLLNAHPQICLGMERYKFKYLRAGAFDAGDFAPERFFDFRAGDTNLLPKTQGRWRGVYEGLAEKYATAQLVGDKIPHLFARFEAAGAVFPQARWIYMLRDIDAVAASWNARARNPGDAWPGANDYRVAVQVWNDANAQVAQLPPARVKIIRYETFFSDARAERRALLAFLDLRADPRFTAAAKASCRRYAEILRRRTPALTPEERAHLAATADLATHAALAARAKPPALQRWLARLPFSERIAS